MVVASRIWPAGNWLLPASMVDLPPTTKLACARFESGCHTVGLGWVVALAAAKCAACAFLQHRFDRHLGVQFVLMRQFLNDQDAVFARSLDKMMAQYSQEVQELYANMRGWRHDYHDHLQALKAYLDKQDTQAARAYLDELEDKLDEVDPLVHSGNAMLDAIVNAKLTLAERLHIPVNEKVIVGSTPLIKDVDLVVILGNLLDNAIEAISEQPAGEPRQLRLYIGIVKQQFYLSITNTRPAEQEIDYQYASTKSDKRGLGIRRVNKLVAKYNGMINRQYEASVFVTEIAIPIHAVKSTTHA